MAVAVAILVALAIGASRLGRVGIERSLLVAAARAVVQLAAVSAIIAVVLERVWASTLFVAVMFAVAVGTAAGRIGARRDWPFVTLALAAGAGPVLLIIFALRVTPFTGPAVIPIAGIVIGGTMTAHNLTARRAFDVLRDDRGQVEAAMALGLPRSAAILLVIGRRAAEAVHPALDQTRTVGLVTLPGAFVGVLLGGGSAAEAASAQVLVLVGLLASETVAVVAAQRLIAAGRILPADVRASLPHR